MRRIRSGRSGGTLRATSRGGDAARGHAGTSHHFSQGVHGERLVENGRSRLKSLLANTLEIPGVKLSSRDRFRAIARLLALDDPEAKELLSAQIARIPETTAAATPSPPPLPSAAPEAKRAYFERFFNEQGLPESWIDAALGPFNAVEHAELTQPYLDLALAALPESSARARSSSSTTGWPPSSADSWTPPPSNSGELRKPA